jgi:hypothetical protein
VPCPAEEGLGPVFRDHGTTCHTPALLISSHGNLISALPASSGTPQRSRPPAAPALFFPSADFVKRSLSGAGLRLRKTGAMLLMGKVEGQSMATKIKIEKRAISIDRWEVAMSEAIGRVVLLLFPAEGDVVPILLRPGQATKLGRDLQSAKFIPKPTVQ